MSKTNKVHRDKSIEKAYKKEIDLSTKIVKSKKAYSRKSKYPTKDF